MFYFFVLDSETTEDEAAEPQIPLEAKEGARGFQDEAQRVPAGRHDAFIMNYYVNFFSVVCLKMFICRAC